MGLKTSTINCHGLKSSIPDINALASDNDILFLQETWLYRDELNLLNSVHADFDGFGISAIDDSNGPISGRPFGGLGIIWRKSLGNCIKIHNYEDPRMLGIEVTSESVTCLFINVYMPYQSDANYESYMNCLGKVAALIEESETTKIAVIGDFNAATDTVFYRELLRWCETFGMSISDMEFLGKDSGTFTYVSEAHQTTSWLDHILCSSDMHKMIMDVSVSEPLPTSDHLPLTIHFDVQFLSINQSNHSMSNSPCKADEPKCNWQKASDNDIQRYCEMTKHHLGFIDIPVTTLTCQDIHCNVAAHKQDIDTFYNDICHALLRCGDCCIGKSKSRQSDIKIIPGWNDQVKDLHSEARDAYILWRDLGKPRSGPACQLMRRTRLVFKYALRHCKRQEESARADAMAKDLHNNKAKSFWSKVAKVQNNELPLPTEVNKCNGEDEISKMWKNHYENIMNCVRGDTGRKSVLSEMKNISQSDRIFIRPDQVMHALKCAKKGKSPGLDLLSTEHFVHADKSVSVFLALLFNSFLSHGYLPAKFMLSAIMPIVKNKTGDTGDKSNYRPIAIVNACSKIFESVLLDLIDDYLFTHDNQFGFKQKHSTDLCIYTLKNVIEYYRSHNSPVFSCFLDASKAFDRVNHWTLFQKLKERNVPTIIIRVLMYWYREQDMCVKWGSNITDTFKITNGVRQGSLLSPKLFTLYVNGLSDRLLNSKLGCVINNIYFNHLFYADDLCLLAPSAIALQKMINICNLYGTEHDIVFNPVKSVSLVFKPPRYNLYCPPVYIDNDKVEYVSTVKYLGVLLNASLDDSDEIMKQTRAMYAKGNVLLRKFTNCSHDVKVLLFQAYCTNVYCASLWGHYSSSVFKKIKVAYNNVFRNLFKYDKRCSASNMFVTNNVSTFECLHRKFIFDFRQRALQSTNMLVNTVYNCCKLQTGAIHNMWRKSLYLN